MKNRTIVLTRPTSEFPTNDGFTEALEELGLQVRSIEVLRCISIPYVEISSSISRFVDNHFSWVVFSSPIAVRVFRKLLESAGVGTFPSTIRVAVQGPGTAETVAELFGLQPDIVPDVFVAESLANGLRKVLGEEDRVLHPGARGGRDVIERELTKVNVKVERLATYAIESIELSAANREWLQNADPKSLIFLFMSPSSVTATAKALSKLSHQENLLSEASILSVGPITTHEVEVLGYRVDDEAKDHSVAGVLSMIKASSWC